MIESSTPSLKLNLMRDYPSKEPVAVAICHHGIISNIRFFDKVVEKLNGGNILVYRYYARGHGKSEGKRGYLKSMFELVEDLKVVVNLAKKKILIYQFFLLAIQWEDILVHYLELNIQIK